MTAEAPPVVDPIPPAQTPHRARARLGWRSGWRGVARRPDPAPATLVEATVRGAMALLVLLLAAALAEATVVGEVRHGRAQHLAYVQLRIELAEGTAPVGQTDFEGNLLRLGRPVALMKIDAIGVEEVVLEGTTSTVLADGPGHRRDTVLPGQAGVSLVYGRRSAYGGPFTRLADLREGDTITVTTGQGELRFEVAGLRRAGDSASVIPAGTARLTLATASGPPFLPNEVLRVDADLVGDPVASPPTVLGPGSLSESEELLAGDDSVGLRLLLWSQLLLVSFVGLVLLRRAWGRWQTWVVATPLALMSCLGVAHQALQLLPNLT